MPAFQPHPSDFIARLQNDGWKFAISYLIIFAITVWNIDIAPMTLAMVVLAVSAVNLVQTALIAGYPHSSGFLREPKRPHFRSRADVFTMSLTGYTSALS